MAFKTKKKLVTGVAVLGSVAGASALEAQAVTAETQGVSLQSQVRDIVAEAVSTTTVPTMDDLTSLFGVTGSQGNVLDTFEEFAEEAVAETEKNPSEKNAAFSQLLIDALEDSEFRTGLQLRQDTVWPREGVVYAQPVAVEASAPVAEVAPLSFEAVATPAAPVVEEVAEPVAAPVAEVASPVVAAPVSEPAAPVEATPVSTEAVAAEVVNLVSSAPAAPVSEAAAPVVEASEVSEAVETPAVESTQGSESAAQVEGEHQAAEQAAAQAEAERQAAEQAAAQAEAERQAAEQAAAQAEAERQAAEQAAAEQAAQAQTGSITPTYNYNTSGSYPVGQCTWGVKVMAPWVGDYWGNGGDWAASAAAAGFRTGTTPQVGAVASWNDGGYGHVAYVTAVESNNAIQVYESNYNGIQQIGNYRGTFDPTTAQGTVTYIYPN
ncbi:MULTISPECIES: CHAP domain-containing protein [unclassified Streptococcus]|uniref:CHAP domain-containing protein n=1 Tax=unclassified Streptococcus TaxID=2608887 RepID=UPI001D16598B|nr:MULTISPECIES: CHAP domain-containing protein [unclassified Streptococcus]